MERGGRLSKSYSPRSARAINRWCLAASATQMFIVYVIIKKVPYHVLQLWHAVVMLIWSFYTVVPRLYSSCPKLCGSVIRLNTFFQICIFDVGGVMYVFSACGSKSRNVSKMILFTLVHYINPIFSECQNSWCLIYALKISTMEPVPIH